ncbi:hypothetical protein N9O15_00255 [Gammaproteobacteria bacterium]|nr:hypothetical protein [Gammaproteobacteria bacterium]
MILVKIFIFCVSALFLVAGITTILSPDVNTIFIPIVVETIQEAHFVRGYAGFVAAIGYLSMRCLYSSSKVQVGSICLYIIAVMLVSKIFSFIYDGYTIFSVAGTIMGAIMAISLYLLQKTRKNQLDYNL